MPLIGSISAPAKVNLTLAITGRRPDGFHMLDSLVAFTEFGDRLEFEADRARARAELVLIGPNAAHVSVANNLAQDAGQRMAETFNQQEDWQHLCITLQKNIPVAAGLGGGSSDAATVIRFLCQRWNISLADPKVLALALELGADVPMCLQPRCQHLRGIGERLISAPRLPAGIGIVLAHPGVALATPDVFRVYCQSGADFQGSVSTPPDHFVEFADLIRYLTEVGNDLSPAAQTCVPEISALLDSLQNLKDVGYVAMSGSGASCFALFETVDDAEQAASAFTNTHREYWCTATNFC